MDNEEKAAHFAVMNPLVNAMFNRCEDFVEDAGFFLPFGAMMMADEELQLVEVTPPEDEEMPNPRAVANGVKDALKGAANGSGAVAVATAELVILEEGAQNSVKVYCEHQSGFCMVFYLPWKHGAGNTIEFGEIKQLNAEAVVGGWT